MIRAISTCAVAAALALGACGGEDEAAGPDLVGYLPEDATVLAEVDLDAVRSELDLADDADALDFEEVLAGDADPEGPEVALLSAAGIGMPPLTTSFQTLQADPVSEAFDGAAISAAANATGDGGTTTVVQTDQSFDDLAGALEAEGYERDGDMLAAADAPIAEIADAGDGVFVLTSEAGVAGDAAAEPPGGPADLVDLIEPADEPIAQAGTALESDCVTAYGGWENAELTEGAIRITLDRDADVDAVDLGAFEDADTLSVDEPVADGEAVEIPFTADAERPASAVRELLATFGSNLYDC